ncbi:MAG: type IV toxin-antitoxin system AbiEi family antitoxin domain-containing protein [Desulfobacterales bacterium]|nr:type IV toxin-antitoxin system AbiEi family antitoxin domain-containing protein [Desulfobacterales bacterium]
MNKLSGIGKKERRQLSEVLRQTKGIISVSEATDILKTDRSSAAKMLARWTEKGWLSRIRRGLYVAVPLESRIADIPLEEPWIFAEYLYSPCYIGGWTAAEYWGLTEQIFRTIVVLTTSKPRDRAPEIKNIKYMVRTIQKNAMFGLKPVWKGEVKMLVSDPTRTLIDMLNDPSLGGGIRPTADVFRSYIKSQYLDMKLLIDYANKMRNGAVFKRLGFILERMFPTEQKTISECQKAITKGNAKLDPKLPADRLITKWKLWIPNNWA